VPKNGDIGQVTVWSDQHHPFIDVQAHEAIYKFIRGRTDIHVHIGDCLDLGAISSYVADDLIAQCEDPVEAGLISFGAHLNRLLKITPEAKVYWIFGNHDDRLRRFVKKHPAWRGILDNPIKLLQVWGNCPDANRVKIIYLDDFTDDFTIGKMHFCHGFSICKHTASKHVEDYDESVTFGHSHTMQMFTKVNRKHPKGGFCVGHLVSKEARKYLRGRPTRWVTGFGHMDYIKKTGQYQMYLLTILDGGFIFAGKYYGGET